MMPLLLMMALAAPPASGLTATIRVEVARVAAEGNGASEAPGSLAGLGPVLAQMLTPDGPVDMTWYADGNGVRATIAQRLSLLPAGAIVIQRRQAPQIEVLNPSAQTYYEMPSATSTSLDAMAGVPDLQIRPTGETATIAGQRAERHELTLTLALSASAGPAGGLPRELQITGDLWLTDAFKGDEYRAMLQTLNALMAIPGLGDAVPPGRFPLRTRLRLALLPGIELRSDVVDIRSAAVNPDLLRVPAGFRKVDAPGRGPVR